MELRAIELTAKNRYYHYPGTYMNALASIRHGPIIVLTDIPGEEAITHLPLKEMTDILKGNTTAQHAPQAPYLPPIYILNRKTVKTPIFRCNDTSTDNQNCTSSDANHPHP